MKSIHTLRFRQLLLSLSSADTIKEIGELTNLRDLQLRFSHQRRWTGYEYEAAARETLEALHSSLGKLLDLRDLDIQHDGCLDDGFSSLSGTPLLLRRFVTLLGWHSRLPRWIGQLQNLHDLQLSVKEVLGADIRILAQLPSLTNLHVKIQATPRENMVICRTGFQALKHFEIGCSRMSYIPDLRGRGNAQAPDAGGILQRFRMGQARRCTHWHRASVGPQGDHGANFGPRCQGIQSKSCIVRAKKRC